MAVGFLHAEQALPGTPKELIKGFWPGLVRNPVRKL